MIRSPEILKVVQSATLFNGVLEPMFLQHLGDSEKITLSAGETLLIPGQENETIYIILSGRLCVQAKANDIEPIAILGEGECVGEMSMLGASPVSAYVIAATDCDLFAIDHAAMWALINSSHAAAHNMLNILTSRIRHTNEVAAESMEREHGYTANALIDELTGLYSKQWMHKKVERHLLRNLVGKRHCCLMLLEMDEHASFVEHFGQLGGDQAIRNLAHIMLSCLRPDDQAGCHQGARFAIFLPNTSLANACIAAERLMKASERSMVVLPSGDALPAISVSIGITAARSDDDPNKLFDRAARALKLAQENGGDCIKSL
ncbi:MAG: GGDEF domain-containing protein [Gallionella sp.]